MKIFIKYDTGNDRACETRNNLIMLTEKRDIEVVSDISKADIIFSIGGDGTFLKTASLTGKPIIGINTGTLGYLTEVHPDNLTKALSDILNGHYHIENRMMIEGEIRKPDGEIIKIPASLNEIAISKNMFGVVRFDAVIDEKFINSYTADGILICTPTGTTAYNLSCGGPIADPTSEILTLTPIAPHTVINRSIILSKDTKIEIKITELRNNTTAYVLYDGKPLEVFSGDIVTINRSDKITRIIKLEERSFIDTIREKIT